VSIKSSVNENGQVKNSLARPDCPLMRCESSGQYNPTIREPISSITYWQNQPEVVEDVVMATASEPRKYVQVSGGS
jgi:hypothetical protein